MGHNKRNVIVDQPKSRNKAWFIIIFILMMTSLLLLVPLFIAKYYLLASILFMILSFIPLVIRFEWKKITGRELVILAILGAIAAVSRVPFATIPSVQPTTFVIIITGAVFGAESGFVVGALAAIVSNLFLGQGPWTPWQMYAWGMIGLLSGLLKNKWIIQHGVGRIIFGVISGFLFSWIMNVWIIMGALEGLTLKGALAFYVTSFPFDLAHALSNAFFLLVFGKSWIKILKRFQKKYGLLET